MAALPGSKLCVNNKLVTGFQARLNVKPLSLLMMFWLNLIWSNINRDNGFTLSRAWNPVTKLLFTHNLDPGKAAIKPVH
jgi:hypothetical protein